MLLVEILPTNIRGHYLNDLERVDDCTSNCNWSWGDPGGYYYSESSIRSVLVLVNKLIGPHFLIVDRPSDLRS